MAGGQYLHDRFEPGNAPQQLLRHLRRTVRQYAFFRRQTLAVIELFHQFRGQGDITDLRQHGRRFELPEPLGAHGRRQFGGKALHARGAAECDGIGDREYVDQRPDAADQGFLEENFFGHQQAVLHDPRLDGRAQLLGRTGFGQVAEDLSFVDGRDGNVAPRIAGEQNARGLRMQMPYMLQQRGAVHARHAHVRHDHRGRAVFL